MVIETSDPMEKKDVANKAKKSVSKKKQKKGSTGKKKPAHVRKAIDELRAENAELRESYLRLAAEFENYKKMMSRERDNRAQNVREKVLLDFLAVLDDFERTISAIPPKKKKDPIASGVQLIHSQMIKLLENHGVEEVGTIGKEFDVDLHEALMMVKNDHYAPNTVVEVHLKGYKINGRVLRHAKVAVNQ